MSENEYLTFEKWKKWHKEHELDTWLPGVKMQYNRMSQSEYLLSEFLSCPLATQKSINGSLKFKIPVEPLGVVLHLQARLASQSVGDLDWYAKGLMDGLDLIHKNDSPSEDFTLVNRQFYSLQRMLEKSEAHKWYAFGNSIPQALRLLYGEEKTMAVMRIWIEHASSDSCEYGIMLELLNGWDELRQYPSEWAFSIASRGKKTRNKGNGNKKNDLELIGS